MNLRRCLSPLLLLGVLAPPACAQAYFNFGKPLIEASATADARSTGIEASFTFLVHGGVSVYKLRETPMAGPNTGMRIDLGCGLGDDTQGGLAECFHFSAGLSLVSDPDKSRDHRVNGVGLFAQADLTLGAHVLVGAYALGPLAKGQDFGTVGVKVGYRFPPYR